jgi:hypothetical protein
LAVRTQNERLHVTWPSEGAIDVRVVQVVHTEIRLATSEQQRGTDSQKTELSHLESSGNSAVGAVH